MGFRIIYAAAALTTASASSGERPKLYTPAVKAFFNDVVSPVERSRQLADDDGAGSRATIDLSDYSFRYARCQTLTMWNDEAAAQGDDGYNYGVRQSVTTAEDFVVFRFCPTESCVDGSSYGNNGNPYGCTSGYGEYMLPLVDYLEERFNYLENKRLQHCSKCVDAGCPDYSNGANYNYDAVDDNINYQGQDNSYYYNNDDQGGQTTYYKYSNANSNSYNGQYNNYYNHRRLSNYTDDDADPCEEACPDYNQTCGSEFYYNQDFSPATYFECSAIYGYNNQGQEIMLYVGAHCASRSGYYTNDNDIAIGLFSDQYCTQFVGDKIDIATFTNMPFENDMLKRYYSESCESCLAADLEYYDIDDDGDDGRISRSCAYLYGISAKCHKYMVGYNYTGANTTVSDYEKSVDEKNCAFIENVAAGKYSETGEIIISNKKYNNQKRKHSEHQEEVSAVALDQAVWLAGFALVNVGLLVYCVVIIRTIRSRKPWRKTGGGVATLATKVSHATEGLSSRNFNYKGGAMA